MFILLLLATLATYEILSNFQANNNIFIYFQTLI